MKRLTATDPETQAPDIVALTFADGNRSRVYLARVKAYRIAGLPQGFDGDLGHMQHTAKLTLTSTAIQK